MRIFCFDFDNTIANGHTHNAICEVQKRFGRPLTAEEQWQVVHAIPPIGSKEIWQQLLSALHAHQYQIAIISFNAFPHIITRYLRENVGLSEALLDKIFVHAWLPIIPSQSNKNDHLLNVKSHYNFTGHNSEVTLVDDDFRRNISGAIAAGYDTIWADPEGQFLTNIQRRINFSKPTVSLSNHGFLSIPKILVNGEPIEDSDNSLKP